VYCDIHNNGTKDLIGFRSVFVLLYIEFFVFKYKLKPIINIAQTPFVCRLMDIETWQKMKGVGT
jgi:hypothetical protein